MNLRNLLIWGIVLLLLVALFNLLQGPPQAANANQISYSQFLDQVESDEINRAEIRGERIIGQNGTGDTFVANLPPQDDQLISTLRKNGVTINARPEEGPSIWMVLLYQSLPFLLILGIAFFALRQMQKGGGAGGAAGLHRTSRPVPASAHHRRARPARRLPPGRPQCGRPAPGHRVGARQGSGGHR